MGGWLDAALDGLGVVEVQGEGDPGELDPYPLLVVIVLGLGSVDLVVLLLELLESLDELEGLLFLHPGGFDLNGILLLVVLPVMRSLCLFLYPVLGEESLQLSDVALPEIVLVTGDLDVEVFEHLDHVQFLQAHSGIEYLP